MPVVQHHVTRPDGTPAALLDVHIDLVTGDQSRVAFRRSDKAGLAARVDLEPGASSWTADLVESSNIQPAGSVYRVTIHIEDAPRQVWHFKVPAAAGPHELVDVLCDPPTGPQAIVVGDSGIGINSVHVDQTTGAIVLTLADGRTFALAAADITATGLGTVPFGDAPFGGTPVPPSALLPLLGLAPFGLAPLGGNPA